MDKSVPAVISSMKRMADGTWRLIIDCQEMNSLTVAEIDAVSGQAGEFIFKVTP